MSDNYLKERINEIYKENVSETEDGIFPITQLWFIESSLKGCVGAIEDLHSFIDMLLVKLNIDKEDTEAYAKIVEEWEEWKKQ